jgi:decaprenylphospho-beta-D-erythro-pentofuranosid-2-ulose 2-reductase
MPGSLRSVLILGATSDIAAAIARRYGALHHDLVLAAREPGRLSVLAAELEAAHGVRVRICRIDVLEIGAHTAFIDALAPLPDIAICAVGLLEPQASLIANPVRTRIMMETNYLAPALLLAEIAERMEARGSGTIVGISSVAGDRGRASNYIYGSAKAGFSAFLSGLRARLSR